MGAIIGNYDMKDTCELSYILVEKKLVKYQVISHIEYHEKEKW